MMSKGAGRPVRPDSPDSPQIGLRQKPYNRRPQSRGGESIGLRLHNLSISEHEILIPKISSTSQRTSAIAET